MRVCLARAPVETEGAKGRPGDFKENRWKFKASAARRTAVKTDTYREREHRSYRGAAAADRLSRGRVRGDGGTAYVDSPASAQLERI